MTIITYDKAMELIRGIVKTAGSQSKAAKQLDISAQYLGDVLAGKRVISDQLARRLPPTGYRRVIFFEKVFPSDTSEKTK